MSNLGVAVVGYCCYCCCFIVVVVAVVVQDQLDQSHLLMMAKMLTHTYNYGNGKKHESKNNKKNKNRNKNNNISNSIARAK